MLLLSLNRAAAGFKSSTSQEDSTTFIRRKKRLTEESMSPSLRGMEYAVRGTVVIAADKINDELAAGASGEKYPFDHIVYTNIGNPHSVGQKPLTWPRQVLALSDLPDEVGVNHPDASKLFPADAIRRAKEIKIALRGHGTGAYSHSKGVRSFREDVAKFIKERDGGIPSDPEDIFLCNGASAAIENVLKALVADSSW
jgi:aspartate/methionine/tyrosine aminotransferase